MIIPSAGFGSRLGSPESKEMLLDNLQPLIHFSLNLAKKWDWPVLIITRREKRNLIEYIKKLQLEGHKISVLLVEPTRDWPETILASQLYWHEWNFVVLPDTVFSPTETLKNMYSRALRGSLDLLVATHPVADLSTWGVIDVRSTHKTIVCEKPKLKHPGQAWGSYLFHKSIGQELLSQQLASVLDQKPRELKLRTKCFEFAYFQDKTRFLNSDQNSTSRITT